MRVSHPDQVEDGISLNVQEAARLTASCTMRELAVADIMVDPAVSGQTRLEFSERNGEIVVVKDCTVLFWAAKNCTQPTTRGLCLRFKGIEYLPILHTWAQMSNLAVIALGSATEI